MNLRTRDVRTVGQREEAESAEGGDELLEDADEDAQLGTVAVALLGSRVCGGGRRGGR